MGVRQKWDVIGHRGWEVSESSGHQIFIFFVNENWIFVVTRHHAEPNNISLTRNLSFESDIRLWSHPSMIPLHCLWAKSNNGTPGQFECDGLGFVLILVSFTVQLFHSLFTFTFKYFTTAHARVWSHENTKIVGLQLNEKKSTESQTRLMSWYWKGKSTWRKDLTTYDSHPWIMFYFNWLVIIWRGGRGGGSLETGRPRSREWKKFGRGWTRGVGESWKLGNFHGRHMCIITNTEQEFTEIEAWLLQMFFICLHYQLSSIYSIFTH